MFISKKKLQELEDKNFNIQSRLAALSNQVEGYSRIHGGLYFVEPPRTRVNSSELSLRTMLKVLMNYLDVELIHTPEKITCIKRKKGNIK